MRTWCKNILRFLDHQRKTSFIVKHMSGLIKQMSALVKRPLTIAILLGVVIIIILQFLGFQLSLPYQMIAIVIAIGGVWFDNEKLKENRAQATVNLLRFFVDDIAGSYPKDHPSYKGVTTRDFALVRVLYDAEEIARKIEGSEIESFLEHSPN